ncbi:Autoinducer 2-degrading protein LsrG [Pigmentiphaga humi]|uniref:Autoinducer 2-degrading protein LsrG n=1 Tax=Pigmentiphaga humi TaxID=2478468 RepID=A0A3P4B435_9BURK|nr:putative quinol monooxygenase [Pigmentiphaga humi]VCU71049.1 Autoinducer 2-degrading protein LsrG [Pigmentiphaga humi]
MANDAGHFGLIVEFEVKKEHLDRFNELVAENARLSASNEPGCRQFDVLQDTSDPCRIVLYEIYDDAAAFKDRHIPAEHTQRFLAAARELATSQTSRRLIRIAANAKERQ